MTRDPFLVALGALLQWLPPNVSKTKRAVPSEMQGRVGSVNLVGTSAAW